MFCVLILSFLDVCSYMYLYSFKYLPFLHQLLYTDPAVKITDCIRLHSGVATGHERQLVQEKAVGDNCVGNNAAPILHFGSTFRQSAVFPNMISMPMPEPHHL